MAGQPRSRARKKGQQKPAGEDAGDKKGPPAAEEEQAPRARARPGVSRTRERQPNWLDIGPEVRHAVDEQRAEQVRSFAGAMGHHGAEVQIERTRPTWCAGYLESRDVGPGAWRELLEYIRDEYGGERYRLALVTPNGTELAHVNQPIAGPPKERGRAINRDRYERQLRGESEEPKPQPAPQPQPQQPPPEQNTELIRMMLEQQEKASKATLEAVRDMVQSSKEHTNQLLGELVKPQQGSLGEQLRSLHENVQAVEKIREDLAPEPDPTPPQQDQPDLKEQREQMRSSFIEQAILQKFIGGGLPGAGAGGGAQQPPQPPPKHERKPPAPSQSPANGKRPPRAVEE